MKIKYWGIVSTGVVLVMLLATAPLAAAAKIAVVDISKVVKEYSKAKEAQTRLEKELYDKKGKLKDLSNQLEKERADLERQKGIVPESKFKARQKKLEEKQDALRERYQEAQSTFMNNQRMLKEGILNDVKEIVAQIAKSEKYELVLDKETALYYGGEDITYKVLDQLNKRL